MLWTFVGFSFKSPSYLWFSHVSKEGDRVTPVAVWYLCFSLWEYNKNGNSHFLFRDTFTDGRTVSSAVRRLPERCLPHCCCCCCDQLSSGIWVFLIDYYRGRFVQEINILTLEVSLWVETVMHYCWHERKSICQNMSDWSSIRWNVYDKKAEGRVDRVDRKRKYRDCHWEWYGHFVK